MNDNNSIIVSLLSNVHKEMLPSFGLTEHSNFPTAAFEPAKSNNVTMVTESVNFRINLVLIFYLIVSNALCMHCVCFIFMK